MKAIKKILNNIFIDGLSGMALGLFSTLIIGTILKQIGDLMGGTYGAYLSTFAVIAQRLTGAGIGIGVAYKFRESTYVLLSAAAAGMIGAYASNLIAGTLLSEQGALVLSGPGEPLGAFVAAYVGIVVGRLVAGKTKLDLLITPAVTILSGGAVGVLVGPGVSRFMSMAWKSGKLGNRAAAHSYGNCGVCCDGNGADTAHQLGRSWNYPGLKWGGSRCGNNRMLLSDDRFCSDQL